MTVKPLAKTSNDDYQTPARWDKTYLAVHDTRCGPVALWRIVGEAARDSSGGYRTLYVLLSDRKGIPDVIQALSKVAADETWYAIHSITRMWISFPKEIVDPEDIQRPRT